MKRKIRISMFITFISFFTTLHLLSSYCFSKSPETKMTEQEYRNVRRFQDQYHQLYRAGVQAEKRNDYKLAIEYFEKALAMVKGYGPETIFRSALQELHEKVGNYRQALVHTEWFLEKSDASSPLWPEFLETKDRLLTKIREQEEWESKQNPVVPAFKESFEKASHAEQAAVLSTFGGKGIWEDFKNALVAEHAGNFSEARQIYESLLAKKAEIEKEMGVHGWAMLYPAIQRTSEFLKDKEREKEALIWIQRNLLSPNGEYHASLSKLLPEVVAHIKERLREYNL